jgi:ATP-dependent helicase HrpB
MPREPLPIDAALPDLLAALRTNGAAVLRAPTGAGKTTRVPPAILETGLAAQGMVVMLEPRRVAARAAARRMASEDGSPLGERFGYQVRFDRKAGPRTRVLVVTPGVLLRLFHDNPYLEGISCIIFDEFHERGLESDLLLGMVKLLRDNVRPELMAIVMSATIEVEPVSAYFGNCPVVASEGRSFPVEVRYLPRRSDTPQPQAIAAAVRAALEENDGDVLVFLPGLREIRQAAEELGLIPDIEILSLHGDLPPEQQDRALQKFDHRKIVLATNVAETSVTVEGITSVVDSGLVRQMEFEPSVGMDRLRLVPISRASADQRAGRAGRTQPGICIRLWDEPGHRSRPEHTEPEIRRVDLAGAILNLLALGETQIQQFPWLDPPRAESVAESLRLLEQLGFVERNSLTEVGRSAGRLPIHPRLARLLVEGQRLGIPNRAAMAAALLSEREPFVRDSGSRPFIRNAPMTFSDVLDRVESLETFERTQRLDTPQGTLHRGGAFAVLQARNQLASLAALEGPKTTPPELYPDEALFRAVFAAYSDRLARRREPGSSRAVMLGGRGVKLAPSSGVVEPELFVCVDVEAGGPDALVRIASGVQRSWLPADRITTRIEVEFDEQSERIMARKQIRFDDLLLEESQAHIADDDEAARVLAAAAGQRLEKVLPPAESEASRFRTRVRCLRSWLPNSGLPDFEAEDLQGLLEQLARGRRSLAELRTGPWLDLLKGQLTYEQLRLVEREAPDRLEVPSGSHIRLEYEEGRPPVLASRIQELFGLTETPRVAGGRVKVLLHLLAPNYRPQQVTDDLASFWKNTYPQVRKELRGRYPKHDWPEDPLTAAAIRGPKRRTS